ncbi:LEA type 2 family protein [Desulfogranum mediterraneum]|uniref:LEA type 2 family protein n=1 Tax=Desulfogranum mediterraneum TaxID=160661 RepID=UPI0004139818|nr:LEA type 2 family protein [Desulfogranum mediterraneum]
MGRGVVLGGLLLLVLLFGGCAGLGRLAEQPRITIADIQVEEVRGMETSFLVQLRVMNPNKIGLDVESVDCELHIDGRKFASGISGSRQEIPAYGTALVPVRVYASMFEMISSVVGLIQANSSTTTLQPLSYLLTGNVRLGNSGFSKKIPFESSGELSLQGMEQSQ